MNGYANVQECIEMEIACIGWSALPDCSQGDARFMGQGPRETSKTRDEMFNK
jgi:hypothetical protein